MSSLTLSNTSSASFSLVNTKVKYSNVRDRNASGDCPCSEIGRRATVEMIGYGTFRETVSAGCKLRWLRTTYPYLLFSFTVLILEDEMVCSEMKGTFDVQTGFRV